MKALLQLSLLGLLLIITFIFYKIYFFEEPFVEDKNPKINKEIIESDINKNNIIKNLKYEVEMSDNSKYVIKAELGEVIFENNVEVVLMSNVNAFFKDENNKKLFISSNKAKFNSNNYYTLFKDDIRIKYESHIITSNNLDFDFIENNILIYDNVIYSGIDKRVETDNIKIDILTKDIEIFMNELNNNVKLSF